MRIAMAAFLGMFCAASIGGLVFAAEKAAPDGKTLFEKKCGSCHSLERPKSKTKTPEGWDATVMRMKDKNGASVTKEEAKAIAEYLGKTYAKK
jgi:cytochrome c2